MKILVISPQPFFSVRGTPISTLRMLKVPLEDGADIDIVTYPIGEDLKEYPNLKFHRCWNLPFLKTIPIGPSLRKLFLDFFLFWKALAMLCKNKYDIIHGMEEGAIMAYPFVKIFKTPLLYDMDSFIPDQLERHPLFKFPLLVKLGHFLDTRAIKLSKAITTVCADLTIKVHQVFPDKKVFQIEDVPMRNKDIPLPPKEKEEFLKKLKPNGQKVILYSGNFSKYQGIDLLLQSLPHLVKSGLDFRLLLVGGEQDQIINLKEDAQQLGVADKIVFAGKQPLERVNAFFELGDILVSPRSMGTNTPLKIYSYMETGIPIVATDMWTHQQALNKECAVLTEPNPEAYAKGIQTLLEDETLGKQLGQKAIQEVNERFSDELFDKKTREMYAYMLKSEPIRK